MTGKINKSWWILDIGASRHITGDISIMTNLHDILASKMGMLNGDHTAATKEGVVILDKNITLSNVYMFQI